MILIDPMSRKTIYDQLTEKIEQLVLAGVYPADTQLPSVRSLSCSLSVNPNTIQKAYTQLCNNGIAYSVAGKGCFVSPRALTVLNERARAHLPEFQQMVARLMDSGISPGELKNLIDKTESERSGSNDPVNGINQTI